LLPEAYVKVLSADFHQPLFSVFPSVILSLPKASHTKRPKVKPQQPKKQAKPLFLLQGSFIAANRVKPWGGV
jgi:hypothetical protein